MLELIADEDFQTELGQFNVEINIPPRSLAGAVFAELEDCVRATSTTPRRRRAGRTRT